MAALSFSTGLWMGFRQARGVRAKWKVLFGKPDDLDTRIRSVLERKLLEVKQNQAPSLPLRQYVTAQTVLSLFLLFLTLLFEHYLSGLQMSLLSLFIILSLINSGAMLDQRRWVFYLEFTRLLVLIISIGVFYQNAVLTGMLAILVSLLVYYFRPMERRYLCLLYQHKKKR